MANLSLHALNKWLRRRIPLNQDFLAHIRRIAKEFGPEPKEFFYKDLTIIGALDETGVPTVVTVYTTNPKKNTRRRKRPCHGPGRSSRQYNA